MAPAVPTAAQPAGGSTTTQPTAISVQASNATSQASANTATAQPAASRAASGQSSPSQAAPPRATATSLPTLPSTALGSLPAEQRGVVRDGHSALAGGDFARAIALLEPLANQLTGDPQAEVRLIYGQALLGDRQFDKALATSETLLASTAARARADLNSAARLLKGQALRGLERWDEAAVELRAVADANPLVSAAVRLELEDMWLSANRPDEAAADGQQGLDVAQARLLKIDLAEKLGSADVALNHTDAAMEAYRQLLTAAGTKGYLGEQLYNLAVGTSKLGRTDDAINALRTSIAQFPRSRKAPDAVDLLEKLGGMRPEDRFYAGVIRYLFWNFRGARADFEAYLAAFPDGDRAVEARYYHGLASVAKDTTTQLLQLASDVPDDDFAPMAMLEAGKAQEELADYASAERIYDRLVATYPTRDAGMAGAFRRGLARFMRGNMDGAIVAWNELLNREPEPPVRAQALYWFVRAQALVQHGLYRQANWEAEIFLTTYADKPDRLYWLAARFGEMGLPNAQLKLGNAALNGATAEGQVSILDVPAALARVASPLAFPELVTSAAKTRGFDSLLFTSLMHQESDFDPYAESVARAKGLTQIIPQTANEIARALRVQSFQPQDLFSPKQNVQFGAYYFAERLKRNGSIDRALAAYNAGDGNVDNWTTPGRDDPDVFTEYIPFAETHDYVKHIQLYWWINRYLWAR
ncbi:MAG: transglycosylase SLT domain-containing protein [Chloroflexi bacterium]|nr:transglycosylase SLT domain-containing protein [Chloroflexota bacterium]